MPSSQREIEEQLIAQNCNQENVEDRSDGRDRKTLLAK